jgi:hypothetical protein
MLNLWMRSTPNQVPSYATHQIGVRKDSSISRIAPRAVHNPT